MNHRQELSVKLLEHDMVVSALTIEVYRPKVKSESKRKKQSQLIRDLNKSVDDKKAEIMSHVDYMVAQERQEGYDTGYAQAHSEAVDEYCD